MGRIEKLPISQFEEFYVNKNMDSEVATALKSVDINSEKVPTCELCRAENPIKKCSKSHSRCKGKLFCNKNCEFGFHKREKEAKEEEAKTEDAPSKENEEEIRRKEELDAVAKAEKAKLKKAKKIANKA